MSSDDTSFEKSRHRGRAYPLCRAYTGYENESTLDASTAIGGLADKYGLRASGWAR